MNPNNGLDMPLLRSTSAGFPMDAIDRGMVTDVIRKTRSEIAAIPQLRGALLMPLYAVAKLPSAITTPTTSMNMLFDATANTFPSGHWCDVRSLILWAIAVLRIS